MITKKMKEIKTLFKKDYIRPHVAVFDVAEDSHLLVSSPNVRALEQVVVPLELLRLNL